MDIDSHFLWFVLAGFVAQVIDGALGMAYGVSASSMLLTLGLPPPPWSALRSMQRSAFRQPHPRFRIRLSVTSTKSCSGGWLFPVC